MTAYEVMTPDSNNNTLVIFSDFEEETFQPIKVMTFTSDAIVTTRRTSGGGSFGAPSPRRLGNMTLTVGGKSANVNSNGDAESSDDSALRKAARKCVDLQNVDLIPTKSCKFAVNSPQQK